MLAKTINLRASNTSNGLRLSYRKKNFDLFYPGKIWASYPQDSKKVLIDNLTYLLTINVPLVSKFRKVVYNISKPFFEKQFKSIVLNGIPSATHDYRQYTKDFVERFLNTQIVFKDNKVKKPVYKEKLRNNTIVPLSCGKDSLLTLAVAKEAGLVA